MNRREIIEAILKKGLAKNGKDTSPTNDWIREQLMIIYSVHPETNDSPFSDFEKLPPKSLEGTFYFEKLPNNQFRPIPYRLSSTIRCETLNISTISNAYFNKESEPTVIKIKIMAYLFSYPLSEKQIQVIEGKRDNTDTSASLKNYLSSIRLAYKKEDILTQIIQILTAENHEVVTICTNDLQFVILLSSSIIEFLHKGKKLYILYDPPSMYDLVSYRLLLLQQFGANIYILPIKNKYPVYGVFPNWDIQQIENLPQSALLFTTNLFNEIRDGRVFAKCIDSVTEIRDCIHKIKRHHSEIDQSLHAIALKQHTQIKIEPVSETDYIDFIKDLFQSDSNSSIYKNTDVSFKTIPLESIFRRKDSFTKFRLAQQYQFMEYSIAKRWIEIDQKTSTLTFKPLFIRMVNGAISPINPPFIEFNPLTNRYEIEEGHIRLWLCYHAYEVKNVRVILVKNIPEQFFKIIDKTIIKKRNLLDKLSWEETMTQTKEEAIHTEDYYTEHRYIERITHTLPRKTLSQLMNSYVDELIQNNILSESDKKLHQYIN